MFDDLVLIDDSQMIDERSTPPELRDAANEARNERLPKKSEPAYWKAFGVFQDWLKMTKVPEGYVSKTVLLAYFKKTCSMPATRHQRCGACRRC